jgi:hypothetical protein
MGFFMMGKNDIIRIYGLLLWILLNESIYVMLTCEIYSFLEQFNIASGIVK